jgi:hypothetical protein
MNYLEIIGVIFSLISILFIIYQNKIGWIFTILATIPFSIFFYNQGLYLDFILQIIFLFQASKAWKSWKCSNKKIDKIDNYYIGITLFIISIIGGWLLNSVLIYSYITFFTFIFFIKLSTCLIFLIFFFFILF